MMLEKTGSENFIVQFTVTVDSKTIFPVFQCVNNQRPIFVRNLRKESRDHNRQPIRLTGFIGYLTGWKVRNFRHKKDINLTMPFPDSFSKLCTFHVTFPNSQQLSLFWFPSHE